MLKHTLTALPGVAAAVAFSIVPAFAVGPTTVVVTPSHTQGWSAVDQRGGTTYAYINDPTSPLPTGALQLTTTDSNVDKIQYMHDASTALASVTQLSYSTKQNAGPATADPSYQLAVYLNGDPSSYTTLVYEPYWNGVVAPNTWQNWDVASGQLWSSRSFSDGTCQVTAGAGGPPFYTLAGLQAACPNAQVVGFGVNVGTYNPGYDVETDAVNFNGTTYNFELANQPVSKDACKNGGYQNLTDANGNAFANQGDCVSFVATGGNNMAH